MADEVEVKCPYCNSKDLSVVPAATLSTTVTYRCQMCRRIFSKSVSQTSKED
nr:hypothetical protein [uncultured archaeon]